MTVGRHQFIDNLEKHAFFFEKYIITSANQADILAIISEVEKKYKVAEYSWVNYIEKPNCGREAGSKLINRVMIRKFY